MPETDSNNPNPQNMNELAEQVLGEKDKQLAQQLHPSVQTPSMAGKEIPSRSFESEVHSANDAGYKNLPLENMATTGLFYQDATEITFRAADVAEIKHWSSIDEHDVLDMDAQMNFILEKCVRIKGPSGWMSWQDITELDRFYILFLVHEITFPNGENKLMLRFHCPPKPQCKGDGKYSEKVWLRSSMLNMFTVDENLMRLYDPSEKCFKKVSSKYNKTYRFYMPTVGVSRRLKEIAKDLLDDGRYVDEDFMNIAPFLIKDWRGLTAEKLEQLRMQTFQWNKNETLYCNGVIDMIRKSVNLIVKHPCPKCDHVLEAPLFFRQGFTIKNLFFISNPDNDLV